MILPIYRKEFMAAKKAKAALDASHRKKNCTNCVHLAYEDGDVNDPEGYTCLKRLTGGESEKKEAELLLKLDSKEYRDRSKRCCEHKYY